MAQIELRLSSKIQKETLRSEVLIRFYEGSKFNLRAKSGLFIDPLHFQYYIDEKQTKLTGAKVYRDSGEVVVKNRIDNEDKRYHTDAKNKIDDLKRTILSAYNDADKREVKGEWLQITIDKYKHPEMYEPKATEQKTFFELYDEFLSKVELSDLRRRHYLVIKRDLQRYEVIYRLENKNEGFSLDIDKIDKELLSDFESFLRNEHKLFEDYPEIYKQFKCVAPKERGRNTIIGIFGKIRAFFNWAIGQDYTDNYPFARTDTDKKNYHIGAERYGTPFYLTLQERNQIADFDLSGYPDLAVQRDIFIFQCLVGSRLGDLQRFTANNISKKGKSLYCEYVPHKTAKNTPQTLSIPLNSRAEALIKKYQSDDKDAMLFPFASQAIYDHDIKKIFRLCGIDRMVTKLNTITGMEEQKPLYELASSHMARRTFIGSLYKQVKDPNLVGALSGHVDGSRAFSRYRTIDDDTKKELVKLIE